MECEGQGSAFLHLADQFDIVRWRLGVCFLYPFLSFLLVDGSVAVLSEMNLEVID